MSTDIVPGVVAVVLVSIATLVIGTWGLRISRTTSDFFVASRTVRPRLNASAIGGEYLSAASFLGVAGLLLTFGAEMLWYPIGWTAGYLVLLVLVAAPLRRSGAYTLPDFAEARLGSRGVRKLCSVLVVAIGWLYLLPQFQGAGRDAARDDRRAAVGGLAGRRGGRAGVGEPGRDAVDHLRAGLPVLAQADRPAGAGLRAAGGVAGRRRGRPRRSRPALVVDPAGRPRRRHRALHDVLPHRRDVPRHDGPAARGRAVLHQPRRPRGSSYDTRGARAAGHLLRPAAGVRRPRPHLRPLAHRRPVGRARARAAVADGGRRAGRAC